MKLIITRASTAPSTGPLSAHSTDAVGSGSPDHSIVGDTGAHTDLATDQTASKINPTPGSVDRKLG